MIPKDLKYSTFIGRSGMTFEHWTKLICELEYRDFPIYAYYFENYTSFLTFF